MNVDIILMLLLVVGIIILFLTEPISADFIAISVPVILIVLNKWTKITTEDALAGFSNTATITVLAMFILSSAVQKYGFVQVLGEKIQSLSDGNVTLRYFIVIATAALIAGILNNTPVVAIFIPLVVGLSRKINASPSKILLPLSYASMMGGTLTLIGSSSNLLASGISERLIGKPFTMFEFTSLGLVVLIFGMAYLMTFGRKLTPARIKPLKDITESYKLNDYLTVVKVKEDSVFTGKTLQDSFEDIDYEFSILDIIREEKDPGYNPERRKIRKGDRLIISGEEEAIVGLTEEYGVELLREDRLRQRDIEEDESEKELIEVIIPIGSAVIGRELDDLDFSKRYNSILFSIRRRRNVSYRDMKSKVLKAGDVLLLKGDRSSFDALSEDQNFIVVRKTDIKDYDKKKMIASLSILIGVIVVTIIGFLPIVISALLGVVIMISTGLIKPNEAYESVDWSVIFLLAGLIPLGIAMEKTGTATFIANQLINISIGMPNIVILGIFYLLTALLTNFLSNNASVILMIPIGIEIASQIGANPFAFVLAVTFAASTAFLTPIGYQTNLMVYGPGGYKFSDYFRVGAPLQIILTIVTPIFINLFWGV